VSVRARVRSIGESAEQRNHGSNVRPSEPTRPEYLTAAEAAAYIRVSLRWLQSTRAVPRVNLAAPGAYRAMWRYKRVDLDDYMARHAVGPAKPRVV
jgi:hypothetical protein